MTPQPPTDPEHPFPPAVSSRPVSGRPVSRRTVLRGAVAVPAAVAVGVAVTACEPSADDDKRLAETLVPIARAAVRQEKAARSLAPRETEYAAALGVVADQRGEHAEALRDEVDRLASSVADQIDDIGTPITTIDGLRDAITASTKVAADTAVAQSGYVAGLLASVSASCRTLTEVQLA